MASGPRGPRLAGTSPAPPVPPVSPAFPAPSADPALSPFPWSPLDVGESEPVLQLIPHPAGIPSRRDPIPFPLTLSRLFSFLRCFRESWRASICCSRRGESFTWTGPEPPPGACPAPTPADGHRPSALPPVTVAQGHGVLSPTRGTSLEKSWLPPAPSQGSPGGRHPTPHPPRFHARPSLPNPLEPPATSSQGRQHPSRTRILPLLPNGAVSQGLGVLGYRFPPGHWGLHAGCVRTSLLFLCSTGRGAGRDKKKQD